MSIDKHLEAKGVTLSDDNSLPHGQRTQRVVKRVIAAVRAAESEFNDELREANERCRQAQAEVIELQDRCFKLEMMVKQASLDDGLRAIESLTIADRNSLLQRITA